MKYLIADDLPKLFLDIAGVKRRMKYTDDQINDPEFVEKQLTRIFNALIDKYGIDDKDDITAACLSTMLEYERLSNQMKFITHHAKDVLMRQVQERREGRVEGVPETRYCSIPECDNPLPYDASGSTKHCISCQANNVGRKLSAKKHAAKLRALRHDIE